MNKRVKQWIDRLCLLGGLVCLVLWVFVLRYRQEIVAADMLDNGTISVRSIELDAGRSYTLRVKGLINANEAAITPETRPSIPITAIVSEYEIRDMQGKTLLKESVRKRSSLDTSNVSSNEEGKSPSSSMSLTHENIDGQTMPYWAFKYGFSSFHAPDSGKVLLTIHNNSAQYSHSGIRKCQFFYTKDGAYKYALFGILLIMVALIVRPLGEIHVPTHVAGTCCLVRRYCASFIDLCVLLALLSAFVRLETVFSTVPWRVAYLMILAIAWVAPELLWRQTLGTFFLKMEVIPKPGRGAWFRILVRRVVNIFEVLLSCLYYVVPAITYTGRTLSDRISGCDVVCMNHSLTPERPYSGFGAKMGRFMLAMLFWWAVLLCLVSLMPILTETCLTL